ncbi:hypothetical protein JNJ66_06650 [Candidatus Saccharibacteria bacterium]|nr:hypothetical protein [Candidatus Saccharibacteria bacterium]
MHHIKRATAWLKGYCSHVNPAVGYGRKTLVFCVGLVGFMTALGVVVFLLSGVIYLNVRAQGLPTTKDVPLEVALTLIAALWTGYGSAVSLAMPVLLATFVPMAYERHQDDRSLSFSERLRRTLRDGADILGHLTLSVVVIAGYHLLAMTLIGNPWSEGLNPAWSVLGRLEMTGIVLVVVLVGLAGWVGYEGVKYWRQVRRPQSPRPPHGHGRS